MSLPQISDFFGSYPEINPEIPTNLSSFNSEVARKQEFAELESDIREPPPPRGGAFKHQKLNVRYLTWYDRLLLLHDPGTGKSCIITHSAELYKNEYLKNPEDPTKIRRAVIIVKGPALAENIKNEIVCRCTDRVYETDMVRRAVNESVMKSNLTRELSTWYDIMTDNEFAKIINKFDREEDLEEYMSNKAFYVDEAHNIPTLKDINDPRPIPFTIAEARALMMADAEKQMAKERKRLAKGLPSRMTSEGSGKEISNYETIFRAFHKGKRNVIVLATATPMRNTPGDIIPLINLILPLNFQMEHVATKSEEEQRAFAERPLDYFEPYFRGRVSYVRALETGAVDTPQGSQIQGYHTHIYAAPMSFHQYNSYREASQERPGIKQESFYSRQRQASNFVFPNGTYGTKAFNDYIEKVGEQYQFRQTEQGQHCLQLVKSEEGLATLSAKYSEIVKICKESFPEAGVITDDKGIIFVYFSDYVHGSGAILLGMCLRENGYEEFKETRSIFVGHEQDAGRNVGPCTSGSDSKVERQTRNYPKKKRFAVFTSVTPKAQIPTILNTLNSYENRYGEYIQVFIGSMTASEGINVNNAVKMIMASSSWNPSTNYQAHERVFRSVSHVTRLAEKRAASGEQNVIIPVKTYNMAAIYNKEYAYELAKESNPGLEMSALPEDNSSTIDTLMYLRAEEKDHLIRKVFRRLKESAIDCIINKTRNVRPTDRDGSPICDYMPCNYECAGYNRDLVKSIDKTTKILYYSDEEVSTCQEVIKMIFSRFYSLKIEQIRQLVKQVIPEMEIIFIDMAIEKTIRENLQLLDRMGFNAYLRESQDGVIYLEKDQFETRARPESTAYSSVLIGTQDPNNNSLVDYLVGLDTVTEKPKIEQLIRLGPESEEFVEILDNLSVVNKVKLLEESLDQREHGRTNDFYNSIMAAFNHAIFEMPEPIDLLKRTAHLLANRGKTRGRKPGPNSQPKIKRLEFDSDFPMPTFDPTIVSSKIYLHTLLNQESHDRTSYNATNRFFNAEGQIRILKPSEGLGWRDVNEYEYMVYNDLIKRRINQIRGYYEQFPIYGIMLPPNYDLHIRDRDKEDASTAAKDARSVYDGKICRFWKKSELIDVLYRLGISSPKPPPPNLTREYAISYLQSQDLSEQKMPQTDDKLVHAYSWYSSGMTREDICNVLLDFFEKTGKLFTGKAQTERSPVVQAPSFMSGSVQVAPSLVAPDYSQSFTLPTSSFMPPIPAEVMPQFAASAGVPNTQVNSIEPIPTNQLYEIPKFVGSVSHPPNL